MIALLTILLAARRVRRALSVLKVAQQALRDVPSARYGKRIFRELREFELRATFHPLSERLVSCDEASYHILMGASSVSPKTSRCKGNPPCFGYQCPRFLCVKSDYVQTRGERQLTSKKQSAPCLGAQSGQALTSVQAPRSLTAPRSSYTCSTTTCRPSLWMRNALSLASLVASV